MTVEGSIEAVVVTQPAGCWRTQGIAHPRRRHPAPPPASEELDLALRLSRRRAGRRLRPAGEDVAGLRGRRRAVAGVGDEGVARIRRVDVDAADEAVGRVRRERVDALEGDRGRRRRVGVVGDEDGAEPGRSPERAGVAGSADQRGQVVPAQGRRELRADLFPVAAEGIRVRRREQLAAVRLQVRLVAAVVGGALDALEAGENGAALGRVRVGDDGDVEGGALLRGDEERIRDPDPVERIVVAEVRVDLRAEVGVERDRRISGVEAGLAAVAEDDLGPGHARAVERKVPLSCVPPRSCLRGRAHPRRRAALSG